MGEQKSKKPPSIHDSICKINDELVVARSEGDTRTVKILEKILIGLERKRDQDKEKKRN